ncbi:MAG: hypothetical protein KC506_01600 [Nanoarchaeota archaeon]|nr:hypothetical protein [Nanoarchaeota archaeon]
MAHAPHKPIHKLEPVRNLRDLARSIYKASKEHVDFNSGNIFCLECCPHFSIVAPHTPILSLNRKREPLGVITYWSPNTSWKENTYSLAGMSFLEAWCKGATNVTSNGSYQKINRYTFAVLPLNSGASKWEFYKTASSEGVEFMIENPTMRTKHTPLFGRQSQSNPQIEINVCHNPSTKFNGRIII